MTHTREEELAMMSSPNRWPQTTVLPLKRYKPEGGWPEMGFLYQPDMRVACAPPAPVVYLGNIFMAGAARKLPYPSLEAILDDGWEID